MPTLPAGRPSPRLIRWLLLAVLVVLWVKTAWLGDDAYITLRTVDNFLHGHGLVWNVGERVQAFTHPLWLLVLTVVYGVLRQPEAALYLAGGLAAAGTLLLVGWRVAAGAGAAALALGALAVSRAWIDYASSGLETPLLYLLVAWFVWLWFRQRDRQGGSVFPLVLAAALILLTRLDALLLIGPALVVALLRTGRSCRRPLLLGLLPLVAWEIFAIVYYGFPVPNTAYAKLSTGIPAGELAVQGLRYLGLAVTSDPFTVLVIVAGALAALRSGRGAWTFALGIGLTLFYVVKIGGDFMAGRFLAVPFLLAVCLLARRPAPTGRWLAASAVILAAALFVPRNPVVAAWRYDLPPDRHGIVDERGYYHRWTGLTSLLRADHVEYEWAVAGRQAGALATSRGGGFQAVESAGMYGFEAGPDLYLVDRFALANAFLARLPANRTWFRGGWRIGHFYRDLPEGYYESVGADRNLVQDPALRKLHDDVQEVTTGPLFAPERWAAIWRLNTRE